MVMLSAVVMMTACGNDSSSEEPPSEEGKDLTSGTATYTIGVDKDFIDMFDITFYPLDSINGITDSISLPSSQFAAISTTTESENLFGNSFGYKTSVTKSFTSFPCDISYYIMVKPKSGITVSQDATYSTSIGVNIDFEGNNGSDVIARSVLSGESSAVSGSIFWRQMVALNAYLVFNARLASVSNNPKLIDGAYSSRRLTAEITSSGDLSSTDLDSLTTFLTSVRRNTIVSSLAEANAICPKFYETVVDGILGTMGFIGGGTAMSFTEPITITFSVTADDASLITSFPKTLTINPDGTYTTN